MGAVLHSLYRTDEERAEPEGKALDLPIFDLLFLPSPMVMKDG